MTGAAAVIAFYQARKAHQTRLEADKAKNDEMKARQRELEKKRSERVLARRSVERKKKKRATASQDDSQPCERCEDAEVVVEADVPKSE